MPKDGDKKPRKPITTVRFLKLTRQTVEELDLDVATVTVGQYIEMLRDKALDEMGV